MVQRLFPKAGLSSDPSGNTPAYGRDHTGAGVGRSRTGDKLRTLTATAIELDDDSSTRNFADRNYGADRTFCGSSDEDVSRAGHTTVIKADDVNTSSNHKGSPSNGGIMIQNEMSISYETRKD